MTDVGDMVQARLLGTFDGEPIVNTLSFVTLAPFATWRDLAQAMYDQAIGSAGWNGSMVVGRSVQYHISEFQVVDVYPGISALVSYTLNDVGTNSTDDALPPNDSLCVTLRSDFKGQGARGRIYLTGYAEDAQNAGYWIGDVQTQVASMMSDLDTEFGELAGASSFRWAVLHRNSFGTVLFPPEIKPIMSYTVHNQVRSIGRRAIGRRIPRHTT